MEFIPLETHSGKKMKKAGKKTSPGKGQKGTETLKSKTNKEVIIKTGKGKLQSKIIEKKKVKNKYREVVGKKKGRSSKKNALKNEKEEDEDEDEDEEDEEGESPKESQETAETDEGEDEDEGEEEEEEEEDEEAVLEKKQQEKLKEKLKKMDEKMKNRLFVKMKKKIINEAQVKELHPDIRGVIFPRKKKSRWCWAVFASQEKALAALKKLSKNSEVLVTKPNPRDRVERKREEKLKSVQRRKENRKKLQQMWT